jgi:hypothetical protein
MSDLEIIVVVFLGTDFTPALLDPNSKHLSIEIVNFKVKNLETVNEK